MTRGYRPHDLIMAYSKNVFNQRNDGPTELIILCQCHCQDSIIDGVLNAIDEMLLTFKNISSNLEGRIIFLIRQK